MGLSVPMNFETLIYADYVIELQTLHFMLIELLAHKIADAIGMQHWTSPAMWRTK